MLFIPYVDELKQNLPILGQGWTLRFQIFFYFTVAFSLIILKNKKYLALLCAFVLLVFLVILNLFESVPFELEYYRAGLFPEFIYGLLLFFIYDYVKRQTKILDISSQSVKIICLSIVVICFAYLVGHDIFGITFSENPNLQKGIPSLILVIALLLIEKQINKQNKIVKFMILLGKASYAMYIFHYLIITVFTRIIFKKVLENNNLFFIEMIILLLTIASTIIISIYSYKLIDMPIQKKLRKLMAR